MTNDFEVGDVVLCTVDRIVGTIVFVKIEGTDIEGSIIFSEVAPGRIRNIRDYVVPKKKIVCKVLRISGNRIDLSLRRVTQKEQKEVLEQFRQEKSYKSVLKTILKDKAEKIIRDITKEQTLYDFLQEAKENSKKLEKLAGKESAKKIIDILKSQKQKTAVIKKEFFLKTSAPDGLQLIKKALEKKDNAEIKYISAGRYSIKSQDQSRKKADNKIRETLAEIEKFAKKNSMEFSFKE